MSLTKHQFFNDIVKVPNLLCLYRLFAIIFCVILFLSGFAVVSSLIGFTAGITDYMDGIYARKHNMVTRLGALLDSVADLMFNFFVIAAGVYMEVWPLFVLFLWGFRDLTVLSMRASAAQLGFDIPSSYLGKVASNFIFYALFLMPLDYALNSPNYMFHDFVAANFHPWTGVGLHWFALCGLLIGIAMQWIAAFQYGRVYIRQYDEIHKNKLHADATPDEPNHLNQTSDDLEVAADMRDASHTDASETTENSDHSERALSTSNADISVQTSSSPQ